MDRDAVWHRNAQSSQRVEREPERNECRFMAKDRSVYWADVHTKVIEYLGKPALQLCIVDISERQACGGGPQAFGKGKNNPESDCQCLSYHLGRSDVRGSSGRCPSGDEK